MFGEYCNQIIETSSEHITTSLSTLKGKKFRIIPIVMELCEMNSAQSDAYIVLKRKGE
jgi:hypothetical protein